MKTSRVRGLSNRSKRVNWKKERKLGCILGRYRKMEAPGTE